MELVTLNMHFPERNKIEAIKETDTETLAGLDSLGLILAPGESFESFKDRLLLISSKLEDMYGRLDKTGELSLFDDEFTFNKSDRIPPDIMEEAAEITDGAYGFSIDWVPGFFLSQSLGLLWGGCAISFPEEHLSVFLIRKSFSKMKRWFIYRRDELLSHELCHVARAPIQGWKFEEHFAYRLSFSGFRRYIGNCFQTTADSLLFILPVLLLVLAEGFRTTFSMYFNRPPLYPIYPFWIIAGIYPCYLMIRNQFYRFSYFKAEKSLKDMGIKRAEPVLFRCNDEEIFEISRLSKDPDGLEKWLDKKKDSDIRWRVITSRFIDKNDEPMEEHNG